MVNLERTGDMFCSFNHVQPIRCPSRDDHYIFQGTAATKAAWEMGPVAPIGTRSIQHVTGRF